MTARPLAIAAALSPADIAAAKRLCRAYAESLGFDLSFQDFEAEMAAFPGDYAAPAGALLLGRVAGRPRGVVALRDLDSGFAEMKRLYVEPGARGSGLGLALSQAIIGEGQRLGYRAMRLDTVIGHHDAALALYRRLGFHEIEPYYDNPLPGALYLQLDY